jgi:Fe-S-cluster containining protein
VHGTPEKPIASTATRLVETTFTPEKITADECAALVTETPKGKENMEHQFNRTTCACKNCTACCRRQPGSLIPGDLERIARHLQIPQSEAEKYFWASPGSLVRDTSTGRVHRIGSITPRFRKGRCVFLDENDRCSIHPVAPFGCSHFDTHMSPVTAHPRSVFLAQSHLDAEYQALRDRLPYATHYKPNRY